MEKPDRTEKQEKGARIAKVLARAGIASRRAAEALIVAGRVAVNGTVLTTPAFIVPIDAAIKVDGKLLAAPEKTRLWRYHKPAGLITTANDPQGRPTVFAHLPKHLPRVVSVGRLDLTSEGLLLLTNDGSLARHLELPSCGWLRRYRVRVHTGSKNLDPAMLDTLKHGITIEGVRYASIEASIDHAKGHNVWLNMGLVEGKNREIRRVIEHMGFHVNRLIRLAYGPLQLGKLAVGAVEEVPGRVLKDQIPGFFAEKA